MRFPMKTLLCFVSKCTIKSVEKSVFICALVDARTCIANRVDNNSSRWTHLCPGITLRKTWIYLVFSSQVNFEAKYWIFHPTNFNLLSNARIFSDQQKDAMSESMGSSGFLVIERSFNLDFLDVDQFSFRVDDLGPSNVLLQVLKTDKCMLFQIKCVKYIRNKTKIFFETLTHAHWVVIANSLVNFCTPRSHRRSKRWRM